MDALELLLLIGRIRYPQNTLESIADMVIHGSDDPQAMAHVPVSAPLIKEDNQPGYDRGNQIVSQVLRVEHFMRVHQGINAGAEDKYGDANQQAVNNWLVQRWLLLHIMNHFL